MENTKKIYKPTFIGVGAVIGGPLVGAYMMAHNFNIFGQRKQAILTWVLSSILFMMLIYMAVSFEHMNKVARLLPFIYGGIFNLISYSMQGNKIKEHIDQGGLSYSLWRVVLVSVIGVLLSLLIIVAYLMLAYNPTSKTYSDMNHTIMYSPDSVSEEEVDRFAEYLMEIKYFGDDYSGCIAIDKNDGVYEITIPETIEAKDNQEILDAYAELLDDMRNTFTFRNKKICIKLCLEDDFTNIIKRIE